MITTDELFLLLTHLLYCLHFLSLSQFIPLMSHTYYNT